MSKTQLSRVTLFLVIHGAASFLPSAPHGHGRVSSNVPPLYSILEKDKSIYVSISSKIDRNPTNKASFREDWNYRFVQLLDVNGDGKVDHKDAGAVASLAFLSWSLMAAPVMAKGSSHSSSSSRSSSSSKSYSRSSSRSYSSSRSSSSSSRPSSSYRSSSRSPSSPSTRSLSSPSKSSRSRVSRSTSSPFSSSSTSSSSNPRANSNSSSRSSSSNKSQIVRERVTMSPSQSSSARLNPKTRTSVSSESSISKKSEVVGERVRISTPNSASARLQVSPNRSSNTRSSQNQFSSSSDKIVTRTVEEKTTPKPPLSSKNSVSSNKKEAMYKSSKETENTAFKSSTALGDPVRSSTKTTSKPSIDTIKGTQSPFVNENLSRVEGKLTSSPSSNKKYKSLTSQPSKVSSKIEPLNDTMKATQPSPVKGNTLSKTVESTSSLDKKVSTKKNTANIPVTSPVTSPATNQKVKTSFQKDMIKKRTPLPTPTTISPIKTSSRNSVPNETGLKKNAIKPSKSAEKSSVTSSDSKAELTVKSLRKRSGNRIGGRAKPNSARETRQAKNPSVRARTERVIVRDNYIINEPPPVSYNERVIVRDDYIINERLSANFITRNPQNIGNNFPPQNLGLAYYYDDYAPPLRKGQHYPSYRRPGAPSYNPQQQPPTSACSSDLPLKNERIDVLVDRVRGTYVQGFVESVDRNKCDFMVTYLSPDGSPLQKSFFAVPQNVGVLQ